MGFQVHLSLSWGVQLLVQGDLNHFSNLTISHVNQAIVALQQVVLLAPVPQQQQVLLLEVVVVVVLDWGFELILLCVLS